VQTLILIAMVLPLADEAGREIDVEMDEDAPILLMGHAADLRNMVRNLLDNALFHGKGKITVTLRRQASQTEAAAVILRVRDEGAGVPEDLRQTVFDRFRKGKASSAGSGLGLAIVRHVADRHGGSARVDPQAGNCIEIALHGIVPPQPAYSATAE